LASSLIRFLSSETAVSNNTYEICTLLGYYKAQSGNSLWTFRVNLLISFSQSRSSFWASWPLKMGPTGCPEMSVRNYHSTHHHHHYHHHHGRTQKQQCNIIHVSLLWDRIQWNRIWLKTQQWKSHNGPDLKHCWLTLSHHNYNNERLNTLCVSKLLSCFIIYHKEQTLPCVTKNFLDCWKKKKAFHGHQYFQKVMWERRCIYDFRSNPNWENILKNYATYLPLVHLMKNTRYMNTTIDVVHHKPSLQSNSSVKYNCTLSIFFSSVRTFII
jgi:hypothetical protein